jgi:hypothetical protein
LNGQIQYGSARPLTFQPTRFRRVPRETDPGRFPDTAAASRPLVLLFGGSLLLGGLLTAAPNDFPGIALAVLLGGCWLSLVLAMTLPRERQLAGQELLRRLALFRHELNAVGNAPSRRELEALVTRAAELGLRDEEVSDELAQIRASADAIDLKERLDRGDLPTAEALDPMQSGNVCHFVCPVRFGRRRSDQFGHLVLTAAWLKFRGPLDVTVAWNEVSTVRRDGREIVVGLQDSRRVLRFSCQSFSEAATGGAIADHLARAGRPEPKNDAPEYRASF